MSPKGTVSLPWHDPPGLHQPALSTVQPHHLPPASMHSTPAPQGLHLGLEDWYLGALTYLGCLALLPASPTEQTPTSPLRLTTKSPLVGSPPWIPGAGALSPSCLLPEPLAWPILWFLCHMAPCLFWYLSVTRLWASYIPYLHLGTSLSQPGACLRGCPESVFTPAESESTVRTLSMLLRAQKAYCQRWQSNPSQCIYALIV